ncbi:transmembrane protein 59-like [Prorops nasuta]|uniref:transmembrane protein 59-like n=1 Tax=Prorops nasuta TaxID=863751 RepID=UPI0034CF817E
MRKQQEIGAFFLICFLKITFADLFYNIINRVDPCIDVCEKTPLSLTNSKYMKSCCQRGCRFFNLVDFHSHLDPNNLNKTKDICNASCTEAYGEAQERYACSTGCELIAKQRISDLYSLISVVLYVEENMDPNVLLTSPDMPESDILSDPGLKKELLPRWWDTNGFKLPQTYIKTVPINTKNTDYGIQLDYSVESEQSVPTPVSNWLQCASRNTGIPQWLLGTAIIAVTLVALWLCLSPDRSNDTTKELILDNSNLPNKVTLYVPDDNGNYMTPPKYVDVIDINLKT